MIFIGCLFLLTGMVYVDAAFAATVNGIRILAHSTSTPSVIDSSINIDVDEDNAPTGLIVNEYVPLGWTLISATPAPDDGPDLVTGKIKWLFINKTGVEDTTIIYKLSVPAGESGTKTFSGELNYKDPANNDAETTEVIGGDTEICISTGLPDDNCDGIDDDCNGFVDDGYVVIQTTCGQGACAGNTGQLECQLGGDEVNTCDPFAGAAPDDSVCNGIDDDCDGPVDEDYVPTDTTCGEGVCGAIGQLECLSGQEVDSCTPGVPTEDPEATCDDGLDNDCDGYIDSLDSVDCPDCIQTGLSDDNCDGIDDDCNGLVDDGYVVIQTTCGQGACAGNTGQLECQPGGDEVNTCDPFAGAAPDDSVCNGIDDDCDGPVDEDYVPTVTSCGEGVCGAAGQLECLSGQVVDSCMPGVPTGDDTDCNGIDENCNGETDENYVVTQTECGKGECYATGDLTCVDGSLVDDCMQGDPTEEGPEATCTDGLDNDCDEATDKADGDCGPVISPDPENGLDFGCLEVDPAEPKTKTLTIANTGNAELMIQSLTIESEDNIFSIDNDNDNCSGSTVAPYGSCDVTVLFDPTTGKEGTNIAELTIADQDTEVPEAVVALRGEATSTSIDLDLDCVPDTEEPGHENDDQITTPDAVTGTGKIKIDITSNPAGTFLTDVRTHSDSDSFLNHTEKPPGYEFIDGLISFKVNDVLPAPDDTVTVVITFPTPIPDGAKYFKVDDNGFYEFGAVINYADNTVTLTLTDAVGTGDRLKGDKDGTLGVIADPGGVASPVATAEICDDVIDNDLDGDTDCDDSDCAQASNCGGGDSDDTVDSSGGGSSGKCFITTAAYGNNMADEVMPLIVLVGMMVIGGVVVIRRRK